MKKLLLVTLVLSFALLVGTVAAQDEGLPTFDDLEEGWNMLEPGGDTLCSQGTEYIFFARPANPDKLMIFFDGGGACWFGMICNVEGPMVTYQPFASPEGDNPELADGVFNLVNEENPFADYSMVFVPYCTADVHMGNSDTSYEVPGQDEEITIHHNGNNNATTVLDWVYENFDAPEMIFVTGSSAGSIPSPFYGGLVAEHYPDAQIAVLGDGSGGYHVQAATLLVNEAWGVLSVVPDWEEYEDYTDATLTFEDYYIASATRFPDVTFATYNTAHDETQYNFLALLGEGGRLLPDQLDAAFTYITDEIDNFNYFIAGGELHTILALPEFYTYAVDGVRFVDWITAYAAGEEVENMVCTDCSVAETVESE
jgi:hypothetical protein